MTEAIKLVSKYGYNFKISKFKKDSKTFIEGDKLHYRTIPEGLLLLINDGPINEKKFKLTSTMIDLSRNQVFKLDYFKEVLVKHALLGFDEVWLYLEDTYEVKEYPKFGYMRGRYSKEELKELNIFANTLGITLIPCVQTLGHMSQFLKWFSTSPYKDTYDILKVGSPKTYELLEAMIKSLKESFNTTKIHVGMDEAFGLGFGRYYKENGYKPQPELFMEHLKKVNEICLKHGFKDVYIWSDMFFRMHSASESYYDPSITFNKAYTSQIPENVTLVYWDYYNSNQELIKSMLKRHLELGRNVAVASGTWVWTKLYYDKTKTDATALNLIEACEALDIKEINFTQWQDDGAYCLYDSIYLGMFDVVNKMHGNSLNKNVFKQISNLSYDLAVRNTKINDLGFLPINLLWDDIILGIYVNERYGYDYKLIDETLVKLENYLKEDLSAYVVLLTRYFYNKLKIRRTLLFNYQNKKSLKEVFSLLLEFEALSADILKAIKTRWLKNNKIFGLEVLESRLEVYKSRSFNLRYLINEYEEGKVDKLDFLEQPLTKEPYLSPKFSDMFYGTKVF